MVRKHIPALSYIHRFNSVNPTAMTMVVKLFDVLLLVSSAPKLLYYSCRSIKVHTAK